MEEIKIVIGSYGSYVARNDRALGSKWLCLDHYEEWDEIVEELKKEGFSLDGIDEELFVQDVEGLPLDAAERNPRELFEVLKESGALDDGYKREVMAAFCEIETFDEFARRVNEGGERWDDDINLWAGRDWYTLGYELIHECYEIPDALEDFIDYERWGSQLLFDGFAEYSGGIIETR